MYEQPKVRDHRPAHDREVKLPSLCECGAEIHEGLTGEVHIGDCSVKTKRATIRNINAYLIEVGKKYDRFNYEFVKGEGYFYFGFTQGAPINTPEPPPSIYVCHLNHADYSKWIEMVQSSVDQWVEENVL